MSSAPFKSAKKSLSPKASINNKSAAGSGGSSASKCCCRRFVSDWGIPMFALQETIGTIDVEASFSPPPRWRTVLLKLILAALTLFILVTDLLWEYEGSNDRRYYLIYLTNWCHIFTVLYTCLSCLISLSPAGLLTKTMNGASTVHSSFVFRFTWGLYSAVATIQMAVALLFWLVEYKVETGCPPYSSLMKHGGFMILVLMEGLVLNSVPIRAKHIVFPSAVAILYLIWTVVHDFLDIGNPFRDDSNPATDDDAIYVVINWRQRPELSARVAAITTFVLIPILFFTLWTAAVGLRRYADTTSTSNTYKHLGP